MKKLIKILSLLLIFTLTFTMLAACKKEEKSKDSDPEPNKNPEKAKEALEKADYEVFLLDEGLDLFFDYEGLKAYLEAADEDGEEGIIIYYFKDSAAAKDAWEEVEKEVEEMKEEEPDLIAKQSGKMIYIGTKDAIKAAK